MRQPQRSVILLLALYGMCVPAFAQDVEKNVMPRVTIVHPGYDSLEADLASLFSLTDKSEQKFKKDLFELLEAFKEGIDTKRPIRIDVLVDRLPSVLVGLPVSDASAVRSTLIEGLLSATSRKDRKDKSLYIATEPGGSKFYMREVGKYLYMADQKNDVAPVVLKAFGPDIAGLVSKNFSLGAELVNTAKDPAAQQARRDRFKQSREELMGALKKMPTETKEAFELRKLSTQHQVNELERLVAETDKLTLGTTLRESAAKATISFDLTAIPGTGLANDIDTYGKSVSMFAAVPQDATAILSVRANHPLSDFRKKHLAEFLSASLPDVLVRLQKSKLSDSEKKAGEAFAKHLNKILGEGVEAGMIDAFVEVTPEADGHHTSVTGLKVPEGTDLVQLVKLLAATNPKHKLEAGAAKFGSIDIHKLTVHLGPKLKKDLGAFFSEKHEVYFGTGATSFWSAAGPDAQAKLKAAIEAVEAAKPGAPNPVVVDITSQLTPWVVLNDKVEASLIDGKKPAEGTLLRTLQDLRKLALKSLKPEEDVVTLKVTRTATGLQGVTEVGKGVLRILGKTLAKESEALSTD